MRSMVRLLRSKVPPLWRSSLAMNSGGSFVSAQDAVRERSRTHEFIDGPLADSLASAHDSSN